jgi:hypothetical protein
MKLPELDLYYTQVLEDALVEYAKHVKDPLKKRSATDLLGMVAFAKRGSVRGG